MRLEGKTAIVTGATVGIEAATSKRFLEEGANTILVGRSKEKLDDFCLLYTSPSPRDLSTSRMPSSA